MFEQQLGGVISAQAGLSGRLDAGETLRGTVEAGGSAGSMPYEIGPGLKVESGVLSVDTAGAVEADNTRPVTSDAVYRELGDVESLLAAL